MNFSFNKWARLLENNYFQYSARFGFDFYTAVVALLSISDHHQWFIIKEY